MNSSFYWRQETGLAGRKLCNLTRCAKNGIISLALEVGSRSPYILKVSKCTISCRKMRKFPCINKNLGRLHTKVAGNWATYRTIVSPAPLPEPYKSLVAKDSFLLRFGVQNIADDIRENDPWATILCIVTRPLEYLDWIELNECEPSIESKRVAKGVGEGGGGGGALPVHEF